MDPATDWKRLGRAVVTRRDDLGMSQLELARDADLSLDTVQAIESARRTSYRPRTLRALETGLQWARGAAQDVLEGRDPTEAPTEAGSGQPLDKGADWDEVRRLLEENKRIIAKIMDRLDDRKRAQVGAAADLITSLVEESTEQDRGQ